MRRPIAGFATGCRLHFKEGTFSGTIIPDTFRIDGPICQSNRELPKFRLNANRERRPLPKSPQEVLVLCRERDVKAVKLQFVDFWGRQQQLTVPISQLSEAAFEDGFGFQSSVTLSQTLPEMSDVLLLPVPSTAWIDPFAALSTVVLHCAILDPITREEHASDPRNIARRAENYLLQTGLADEVVMGGEVGFYIFDHVRYDQAPAAAMYQIASAEESRPQVRNGNKWCASLDHQFNLRNEIMQTLIDCGIAVSGHHAPLTDLGRGEIGLRGSGLLQLADGLGMLKYLVRGVARQHGKSATFMPKPIADDEGCGLHVHFSLWKAGEPLFAGTGYAGLSAMGYHAIGGILRHAPALMAFCNPTTNSYRRLIPGGHAPINLAYSQRSRSAACRVPMTSPSPKAKRIEFRCPDPSCNPYLAFSAILMAAIDGIQNKVDPGEPFDQDQYDLPPETQLGFPQTPASLEAALDALIEDGDFLLRGDVFSEESLADWRNAKRQQEIAPLNSRPHPYEFCLYYDA